jgi:hypothetical protein
MTMTTQDHYLEVVVIPWRTGNYCIFGPGSLLVLLNQLLLFAWLPFYSLQKYLKPAGIW